METKTRTIIEGHGIYVAFTHQFLERTGQRGSILRWSDAGGGGSFFDPTPKDKELLTEHGSPVIVYPDGSAEPATDANLKKTSGIVFQTTPQRG